MAKHQVKFYVSDEEKKRLEALANLRFMTIPNYVKVTALGVQIRQVQEIYVEQYAMPEERIYDGTEMIVGAEEKAVLTDLLNRSNGKDFIRFDTAFNEQLIAVAKRLLNQ